MNKSPLSHRRKSIQYIFSLAFRSNKRVLLDFFLLIICSVCSGIFSLFVLPKMMACLEAGLSLSPLLLTTGFYMVLFMFFLGAYKYLSSVSLIPRVSLRQEILNQIMIKQHQTSFENLLDNQYLEAFNKACEETGSNSAASEHIWLSLEVFFSSIILLIFYLIVLVRMPFWLILLLLLTNVASFYFHKKAQDYAFSRRGEKRKINNRIRYVNQLAQAQDYAKDIRLFNMKDWLKDIREASLRLLFDFQKQVEARFLWVDFLDLVFTILRNAFAYSYLIILLSQNEIPVSAFLLYFQSFTEISNKLTELLNQTDVLQKELDAIAQILEYLEWEETFLFDQKAPKAQADEQGQYSFTFDHVSYCYPGSKQKSVDDLSFHFKGGEKLAVVGLNGAGKTSLIRLLCGFVDPTEGRVLVNGQDIRTLNRNAYYDLFTVVFQKYSLLAGSIKDNILQTAPFDPVRYQRVLAESGMQEIIEELPDGDESLLSKSVYPDATELSGGQMQRLMLARALYRKAPILVLDEPTAALDPLAESALYQKYNELCKQHSSIFISHRLASTRFCDRILVLKDGRLIEEGSHEALMQKNGFYSELFKVQSQYYQKNEQEETL